MFFNPVLTRKSIKQKPKPWAALLETPWNTGRCAYRGIMKGSPELAITRQKENPGNMYRAPDLFLT